MKKLLLVCAAAFLLGACRYQLNNAETVDATLPDTPAPTEMIGDWALQKPGSPVVYKGDATDGGEYLRITANGRNATLFETWPDGGRLKLTGTLRFETESTNSRGAFHFLALSGEAVDGGRRSLTQQETKEIFAKEFQYRMDADWLRIEEGREPTDASRSFRKN